MIFYCTCGHGYASHLRGGGGCTAMCPCSSFRALVPAPLTTTTRSSS